MNYTDIERVCVESKSLFARDYCLAEKSTMRVGGECDIFAEPSSVNALLRILNVCRENGIPYFILGRGSNVIVKHFAGCVIHIGGSMGKITVNGNTITAEAGAKLSAVCSEALENSLGGMESLYGIPGSVGGALFMNAGAYGGEMKDVVVSADCVDNHGNLVTLSAEEMNLAYRKSIFCDRGYCILSVTMDLHPADKTAVKARMDELMQRRRDKQPLEFPSCGSTFKRPLNGFAAALIEECGLKGLTVGGAQVSEKHSGFVINKGGATCDDIEELIRRVKATVREQKGVELECEVIIVE